MGDQAVVVTGVLNRDGDDFETQYEIRRFKIGKFVFCAWCAPQKGDPPDLHYDLADKTLRCKFDPADYETPVDSFLSVDVVPLDGDGTEMFQFIRERFRIEAQGSYWDHEEGSLFHLVLPPNHLPFPEVESIEPQPTYGWRHNERFVIGWQRSLDYRCTFRFRKVAPEDFEKQARELRDKIKKLPPQGGTGKIQVSRDQLREIEEKEALSVSEHYIDFDLHIGPNGHAIANSPEGQKTADIPIQVPNAIKLSMNLIEKRQTNASLLKQIGEELYKWLFPGAIHTHLHQTEARARLEKAKIRLRLRIEAESIATLPLEFLYRMEGGYFLAINPDTVLSRYLNVPLPPERVRRREGPLHMLAIVADPTDQTRLNPDEWEGIIKEALAKPLADGLIILQTVKRATRGKIGDALLAHKPDIIQFVGHGIYQDGEGYLALVDDQTDRTWLVNDEQFANLYLGYGDYLGLISLATCESARSENPQGFLGISPKLVQRGVPAVLAMQYKVLIRTAKIFLEDFYTAIAARKPVDWATQSARKAVSQELGFDNREFATPVLYMRAQDGKVF